MVLFVHNVLYSNSRCRSLNFRFYNLLSWLFHEEVSILAGGDVVGVLGRDWIQFENIEVLFQIRSILPHKVHLVFVSQISWTILLIRRILEGILPTIVLEYRRVKSGFGTRISVTFVQSESHLRKRREIEILVNVDIETRRVFGLQISQWNIIKLVSR